MLSVTILLLLSESKSLLKDKADGETSVKDDINIESERRAIQIQMRHSLWTPGSSLGRAHGIYSVSPGSIPVWPNLLG
jgi:hypothetical protein